MKLEAAKRLTTAKNGSVTPGDAGKILKQVEKILGKGKPKKQDSTEQCVGWHFVDKEANLEIDSLLTYDSVDKFLHLWLDIYDRSNNSDSGFSIDVYGETMKEFMREFKRIYGAEAKNIRLDFEEAEDKANALKSMNAIATKFQSLLN